MKNIFIKTVFMVLLVLGVSAPNAGQAGAAVTVASDNDNMEVGYNYHGSSLTLSGTMDSGAELVFTIASEDVHQKLKEKNKVGGVLWMNTGDVSFEHIPNVYYLISTKAPKDILTEEELSSNGIGYPALLEQAEIEATNEDSDSKSLFDQFVKYKEAARLYSVTVGGFETSEQDGGQKYSTTVEWPYQIPPGDYTVTANAVKDGKIVSKTTTTITVERVGIVKRLTNMAQKNGALYGVLAIIIALAAGFGVGLIFGKGGGAH